MSIEDKINQLTIAIGQHTEALIKNTAAMSEYIKTMQIPAIDNAVHEKCLSIASADPAPKPEPKPKSEPKPKTRTKSKIEIVSPEDVTFAEEPIIPAEAPIINYDELREDAKLVTLQLAKLNRKEAIRMLKAMNVKSADKIEDKDLAVYCSEMSKLLVIEQEKQGIK